jgi:DNA-directed RNA polymerase subunit RPC12/RpoP
MRTADVLRRIMVALGLVFSFILITVFIYPRLGLIPSLLLGLVVTVTVVRAYSLGHSYRCANCGHVFRVPLMVDFFTASGIGKNPDGTYHNWKSLTCPECGERSRAVSVRRAPGDESTRDGAAPGDESTRDRAAPRSDRNRRRRRKVKRR